jgi:hypothetical protein
MPMLRVPAAASDAVQQPSYCSQWLWPLRQSSHGDSSMMPANELVCRGVPARYVTAHAGHDASASRARPVRVPLPSPPRGERGRTPIFTDEKNHGVVQREVSEPVPCVTDGVVIKLTNRALSRPATASQAVPTESGHATGAACGTAPTGRLQSIPSIPRARAFVTASSSSGP